VQVTSDAQTDLTLVLERKPRVTTVAATPAPSPRAAPTSTAHAAPRAPAHRGNAVDDAAASASRGIATGRRWLRQFGL
jgi:hypothetical protein